MELNREQIIKALECCINFKTTADCEGCPSFEHCKESSYWLDKQVLSLIKELTEEYESMAKSVNEASDLIQKLRADKAKLIEENANLKQCMEHEKRELVMTAEAYEKQNYYLKGVINILAKGELGEPPTASQLVAEAEMWRNLAYRERKNIANAIREYQFAIHTYYSQKKYQPTKEHPTPHTMVDHLLRLVDEIANKMTKGE